MLEPSQWRDACCFTGFFANALKESRHTQWQESRRETGVAQTHTVKHQPKTAQPKNTEKSEEHRKQQQQQQQQKKKKSTGATGSSSSGFGGFQKGFLFGGGGSQQSSKTKSAAAKASKPKRIETVRPKDPKAQTGVLPEVQQSMKDAVPFLERTSMLLF